MNINVTILKLLEFVALKSETARLAPELIALFLYNFIAVSLPCIWPKDGKEISKTYHRTSLTPAQDLTGQPANVVAICNAAWTPEVIAAYAAALESK